MALTRDFKETVTANVTDSFEELAEEINQPSKSLPRMLSSIRLLVELDRKAYRPEGFHAVQSFWHNNSKFVLG